MHSTILVQICQFSVLVFTIEAYLLLAANLDDFRTLAQQFIPDKLADQIVKIASEPTLLYKNEKTDRDVITDDDKNSRESHTDESYEMAPKNLPKTSKKDTQILRNSFSNPPPQSTVDIDEIVDEVKKRLEKEYKLKPASAEKRYKQQDDENQEKRTEFSGDGGSENEEISQLRYDTIVSKVTKLHDLRESIHENRDSEKSRVIKIGGTDSGKLLKKSTHKVKNHKHSEDYKYDDINQNSEDKTGQPYSENFDSFQEVSLLKANDSYEDYVTPPKDDISINGRVSRKPRNKYLDLTTAKEKPVSESFNAVSPLYYDDETTASDNIKARTEDLNYDYPEQGVTDVSVKAADVAVKTIDVTKSVSRKVKVNTKNARARTMIPTREHYKMSSPNYYAKIAVVAEKYDFNEPIPERDREPENLKHIGNPPARINKKVKI